MARPPSFQAVNDAIDGLVREMSPQHLGAESEASSPQSLLTSRYQVLDEMLEVFTRAVKARSCDLKQRRNRHLPISKLPVEVLVIILWLVLEDEHRSPGYAYRVYHRRTDITAVCRDWRTLVLQTPMLWSHIGYPSNSEMGRLLHSLKMSRNHPLDVGIHSWPLETDFKGAGRFLTAAWFLEPLESTVHRWRFFVLDWDHMPLPPSLSLLQQPAPSLRRAELHLANKALPYDLFHCDAPLLSSMMLYEAAIPWNARLFSNLEELRLANIREGCPSTEELLDTIRAIPRLRILLIRSVQLRGASGASERPTSQPSNLEELVCTDMPLRFHQLLLKTLNHIPMIREICLHWDQPSPSFGLENNWWPETVKALFLANSPSRIIIKPTSFRWMGRILNQKPDPYAFDISITGTSTPFAPLSWLQRVIGDDLTQRSDIHLRLENFDLREDAVIQELASYSSSFTSITSLTLKAVAQSSKLHQMLANPILQGDPPDQTLIWPFKNIACYGIAHANFDWYDYEVMVRCRAGGADGPMGPTPLRKLRLIPSKDLKMRMRELQQVIGLVEVDWYREWDPGDSDQELDRARREDSDGEGMSESGEEEVEEEGEEEEEAEEDDTDLSDVED